MSTTLIKHDNNIVDKRKEQSKNVKINNEMDIFDSPEEYKIHLQLLAKDLNKNGKIKHLDKLKKKEEP